MKKLMLMLMAFCLTLTVQAQDLTKAQEKAIKKEVKAKLKDFQKQ